MWAVSMLPSIACTQLQVLCCLVAMNSLASIPSDPSTWYTPTAATRVPPMLS